MRSASQSWQCSVFMWGRNPSPFRAAAGGEVQKGGLFRPAKAAIEAGKGIDLVGADGVPIGESF